MICDSELQNLRYFRYCHYLFTSAKDSVLLNLSVEIFCNFFNFSWFCTWVMFQNNRRMHNTNTTCIRSSFYCERNVSRDHTTRTDNSLYWYIPRPAECRNIFIFFFVTKTNTNQTFLLRWKWLCPLWLTSVYWLNVVFEFHVSRCLRMPCM